jgi:hypothetical protein
MKKIIPVLILISAFMLNSCNQPTTTETTSSDQTQIQTHIGTLKYEIGDQFTGYPTKETVNELFYEMDFQRATQAYLWGLPMVAVGSWFQGHENLGAGDLAIVQYITPVSKAGILTANEATPYTIVNTNLANTGPVVMEVPAGPIVGMVDDVWQRVIVDIGLPGPDGGKGGKYLILPPGINAPADVPKDYFVYKSPTNHILSGFRVLSWMVKSREEAVEIENKIKIYKYDDRNNPPARDVVVVENNEKYDTKQPRDMEYWKIVKKIIDQEPVLERDRLIMSMLVSLGIEKGKPFNPTPQQEEILLKAVQVGEQMAKAQTYAKPERFADYFNDYGWPNLLVTSADDKSEHYDQMYRRATFTYEAMSRAWAMFTDQVGVGQVYLTQYKDGNSKWLDGSKDYVLNIPKDAPAELFWSIAVYSTDTRCLIQNEAGFASLGSRTESMKVNDDGSVDLYFGPLAPKGNESNWIQTNNGEAWFTYLRLYGPSETYFDKSWPLKGINLVE